MKKLSTISTYEEVVALTRTYCVFRGIKIKDFVAKLLKRELNDFQKSLNTIKLK